MTPSDADALAVGGPGRRTHVRTLVVSGGLALAGMAFVVAQVGTQMAAGGEGPDDRSWSELLPLLLVVVVIIVRPLYDSAMWFARTYRLAPTELIIDEGILTRHHRVLPFVRVQQVDVHQSFLAQILNLAELRIESAGEGGDTMRLRLLDRELAEQMRRYILERRRQLQSATPEDPAHPAPDPRPLLALGTGELTVAALTHSSLIVGVPFVVLAGLWIAAAMVIAGFDGQTAGLAALVTATTSVAVVFLVGGRLYGSVVGQHGFTLGVQGDDLHLRYGLLEVRQLTIPRWRVQQITVVDNPLRRVLGIVSLTLHSAAGLGGGGQGGSTRFEVPLLPRDRLDDFLGELMGDAELWRAPSLTARPAAAHRRAMVRRGLLLVVAVAPLALAFFPWGLAALAVATVAAPWGRVAHRRAGHAATATLVVFARGVLHHRLELVPLRRVQSCRTAANPLQRRFRLATLHVDVAGDPSAPRLYDMDGPTADALLHRLPRSGVAAGGGYLKNHPAGADVL
jgi:putative membrane protein